MLNKTPSLPTSSSTALNPSPTPLQSLPLKPPDPNSYINTVISQSHLHSHITYSNLSTPPNTHSFSDDSHNHIPKLILLPTHTDNIKDFPPFEGAAVTTWLLQTTTHFSHLHITPRNKVAITSSYLHGQVLKWFTSIKTKYKRNRWQEFHNHTRTKFSGSYLEEQLTSTRENGKRLASILKEKIQNMGSNLEWPNSRKKQQASNLEQFDFISNIVTRILERYVHTFIIARENDDVYKAYRTNLFLAGFSHALTQMLQLFHPTYLENAIPIAFSTIFALSPITNMTQAYSKQNSTNPYSNQRTAGLSDEAKAILEFKLRFTSLIGTNILLVKMSADSHYSNICDIYLVKSVVWLLDVCSLDKKLLPAAKGWILGQNIAIWSMQAHKKQLKDLLIAPVDTIPANREREIDELVAQAAPTSPKAESHTGEIIAQARENAIKESFITTIDKHCEFEDSIILNYDRQISSSQVLGKTLQLPLKNQRRLLIVTETSESIMLDALILNTLYAKIKGSAIKFPNFGEIMKAVLEEFLIIATAITITQADGHEFLGKGEEIKMGLFLLNLSSAQDQNDVQNQTRWITQRTHEVEVKAWSEAPKATRFQERVKNIHSNLMKLVAKATNDMAVSMHTLALQHRMIWLVSDNGVTNLQRTARLCNTSDKLTPLGTISCLADLSTHNILTLMYGRAGFMDRVENFRQSLAKTKMRLAVVTCTSRGNELCNLFEAAYYSKKQLAERPKSDQASVIGDLLHSKLQLKKFEGAKINTSQEITHIVDVFTTGEKKITDLLTNSIEQVSIVGIITKVEGTNMDVVLEDTAKELVLNHEKATLEMLDSYQKFPFPNQTLLSRQIQENQASSTTMKPVELLEFRENCMLALQLALRQGMAATQLTVYRPVLLHSAKSMESTAHIQRIYPRGQGISSGGVLLQAQARGKHLHVSRKKKEDEKLEREENQKEMRKEEADLGEEMSFYRGHVEEMSLKLNDVAVKGRWTRTTCRPLCLQRKSKATARKVPEATII